MIDGFFHADPHPGNVVVDLKNGRLTFLDCGMVGELDLRQRVTFARFLLAFRDGDVSGVGTTLRSLSKPFRKPSNDYPRQFERRIGPLMAASSGDSSSLEKLANTALDVLRDAGYRLAPRSRSVSRRSLRLRRSPLLSPPKPAPPTSPTSPGRQSKSSSRKQSRPTASPAQPENRPSAPPGQPSTPYPAHERPPESGSTSSAKARSRSACVSPSSTVRPPGSNRSRGW